MALSTHGKHHHHKRKRKNKKYKHTKLKAFIDKAVYGVGFFGLVMTIPQIMKIWVYKNAAGISVLSWISYMIVAITWIIYGTLHKERPLIIIYSFWIVFEALIISGTLMYG